MPTKTKPEKKVDAVAERITADRERAELWVLLNQASELINSFNQQIHSANQAAVMCFLERRNKLIRETK